jgi:hypothetical protein
MLQSISKFRHPSQCGLLIVAALTKGSHPQWAIGGMIFLYVLYLAAQCAKHGAGSAHAPGVTDSTMMNVRTSTLGLTTAAAIAAVTVLMPGAVLAGSHPEHFSKAEAEVPHRASTVSVNRSFASSPTQIKYCLIEEQRAEQAIARAILSSTWATARFSSLPRLLE